MLRHASVYGMKKKTLWLPEELWDQLLKLSEKTGAPISELIRRAITAYLKKEKQ
jgi:predicted DNA-binding protein